MAFSIKPPLSIAYQKSSIKDEPDGKKSLFLLHKVVSLAKSGCAFKAEDWKRTAGELIDRYLQSPQENPTIKKDLQGLTLVRNNLGNCICKKIFYAALLESTGTTFSYLAKNQASLNQLYAEQFFTWIQQEFKKIPSDYVLMLIDVWQGFSDLARLDKKKWEDLLSLDKWNGSQKSALKEFKSKYEFLSNFSSLPFPVLEAGSISELDELPILDENIKDRCGLWSTSVDLLIESLHEVKKNSIPFRRIKNVLKSKDVVLKSKDIGKEFIINFKGLVFSSVIGLEKIQQEYDEILQRESFFFQKLLREMDKEIKELEEELHEVNKLVENLKNKLRKDFKDKLVNLKGDRSLTELLNEISQREIHGDVVEQRMQNLLEMGKEYSELQKKSMENIAQMQCSRLEFIEEYEKAINSKYILPKNTISTVLFLSSWLIALLEKEEKKIDHLENARQIAFEDLIKKTEDSYKKLSRKNPIKSLRKTSERSSSSIESFSIESEEDFDSTSCSSDVSTMDSFDEIKDTFEVDAFDEMNGYLQQLKNGENPPLNGILSRTLDGFLQKIQSHLLKTKAPAGLQVLHKQQTKEVWDHLLIGAAGLELLGQAIYDQRLDHVVLGFREALIHCHYAIEQMLYSLIIRKTNQLLDKADEGHDLIKLAEKAQISDLKKWRKFLKEGTLHLAFSYPSDHQIFFHKNNNLEAFSLLQGLNKPNLSKKEIQKAVDFCFGMYCKSMSFIIEVSSAQIKDQLKFLEIIQSLKEQVIQRIHLPSKTISINFKKDLDQPLISQVHKALNHLEPLDTYSHLEDQRTYAAIATIYSYLQLMKISLEIPQDSSKHSLQKFIKVEMIAHIDKLFKHLFRVVTLFQGGEDTHQHDIVKLFNSITGFYNKDAAAIKSIALQLKEINLMISHHYFHTRKSHTTLKLFYNKILKQAHSQIDILDDEYSFPSKGKNCKQLKKNIDSTVKLVNSSFSLFLDLLEPTLSVIKEQFSISRAE